SAAATRRFLALQRAHRRRARSATDVAAEVDLLARPGALAPMREACEPFQRPRKPCREPGARRTRGHDQIRYDIVTSRWSIIAAETGCPTRRVRASRRAARTWSRAATRVDRQNPGPCFRAAARRRALREPRPRNAPNRWPRADIRPVAIAAR